MPRADTTIINRLGLHARAAAKLVQTAGRYASMITISYRDKEVNAKSIMGIMMLAAAQGAEISIVVDGEDADEALAAVLELIEDRFGEPS